MTAGEYWSVEFVWTANGFNVKWKWKQIRKSDQIFKKKSNEKKIGNKALVLSAGDVSEGRGLRVYSLLWNCEKVLKTFCLVPPGCRASATANLTGCRTFYSRCQAPPSDHKTANGWRRSSTLWHHHNTVTLYSIAALISAVGLLVVVKFFTFCLKNL